MRNVIFGIVCLGLVANPTSVRGEIPDWKFPGWVRQFKYCGMFAQAIEDWPGLGLVGEYRHLKRDMLHNAAGKGASSGQLLELLEAFELGRREVIETGWEKGITLEDANPDELNEIISGLRENRQICSGYG